MAGVSELDLSGLVLITAVAWLWQKQRLDAPALVGLALILAGAWIVVTKIKEG